jgi:hypothetical protein
MLSNKHNCVGDLSAQTHGTGTWRYALSAKYNDPRNLKASDALTKISVGIKDLTDSQWAALEPYWASDVWATGVSQTCRQVGFRHVDTLDAFVERLVSTLQILQSQVAA